MRRFAICEGVIGAIGVLGVIGVVGVLAGCTGRDVEPATKPSPPDTEPTTKPVTEPDHGQPPADAGDPPRPSDPSFAVMQKVCASDCAGPYARVAVFRDSAGGVGRLRFDGDLETCSHPPRIYFDASGEATEHIPMEPIGKGTPEEADLRDRQAKQVEGLAARCEPERTEGFRSEFACRSDSDCVGCACDPVDRSEWERRGGPDACNIDGEECIATNPACCAGVCVLAR